MSMNNPNNPQYPPDPRAPEYQQAPQPVQPQQQVPYNGPVAHETVRSATPDGAYAESHRQSYVDPNGNQVVSNEEVFEDQNQKRANTRYWIARVVYFILAVLEVILLLRFIFRLLGANESSSFVLFLYNLSHIFVGPFNGIFNDQGLGRSVFEASTIVAMIVYALIAWGIVSLARLIFAPKLSGNQSYTATRRTRL